MERMLGIHGELAAYIYMFFHLSRRSVVDIAPLPERVNRHHSSPTCSYGDQMTLNFSADR